MLALMPYLAKKHAHEIHFYAKIPLKSEFFFSISMKKYKNDVPGIRHVFTSQYYCFSKSPP